MENFRVDQRDQEENAVGKGKPMVSKLPTLDEFISLLAADNSAVAATPSAYNVYNKYNKSC